MRVGGGEAQGVGSSGSLRCIILLASLIIEGSQYLNFPDAGVMIAWSNQETRDDCGPLALFELN